MRRWLPPIDFAITSLCWRIANEDHWFSPRPLGTTAALLMTLWLGMSALQGIAQQTVNPSASNSKQPHAIDASLHDCYMQSLDRGWTVGDRGLLLETTDGGKSWLPQESGTQAVLHGIDMSTDKNGCIVGGTVQDYSQRSLGIVLNTIDGGKSWKPNPQFDLPCLMGLQAFEGGHLVAWGDYSPHLRTSIFESIDHGMTWNSSGISLGHLQSCAWGNRHLGIAIDRLSRIYRIEGINQVTKLPFGGDPARPLLCVQATESGFWMGGAEGQLFRSLNGTDWNRVLLPGTERDHRWITIQSIHAIGEQIWVAGRPGNVIWHSNDAGKSWSVQSIPHSLSIESLHAASVERLIAVGPMARIIGTRNGGRGWWIENDQGDRIGLLNLAATEMSASWDAMALASWQYSRQAALYISHASRFETKVDMSPDLSSKLETIRSRVSLAETHIEPSFPVRQADFENAESLAAYGRSNVGSIPEVTLALVQEIRATRPDVIVTDTQTDIKKLTGRHCKASLDAIELAADPTLRLFSVQSGIPNTNWKVQKVFARSTSAKSGLTIVPKQILKPGMLLSEVLRPIDSLGLEKPASEREVNRPFVLLQSPSFHETSRREFFVGLTNDPKTGRQFHAKGQGTQEVLQTQQRDSYLESLVSLSGSRFQKDIGWDQELDRFLTSESGNTMVLQLFAASQQCLANGYWNRWRTITEKLLRTVPNEAASAEAYREFVLYVGSVEVRHWIDRQAAVELSSIEKANSASVAVAVSTPASPFKRGSPVGENEVRLASFSEARDLESSSSKRSNAPRESNSAGAGAIETVPSFINPKMIAWSQKQMSLYQPLCNLDPRIRLSKLFVNSAEDPTKDGKKALFQELKDGAGIAGWCQVGEQELAWIGKKSTPGSMFAYPLATVPKLDGLLDDGCWRGIQPTLLTDPWGTMPLAPTQIQIGYDAGYLFIGIRAPTTKEMESPADLKKGRSYDSLKADRDHIMIRLDLDRDYQTWFGFGVDIAGELCDECCQWRGWNPRWMVASLHQDGFWNTEIAIPIEELSPKPIVPGDCWAANFHRVLPGIGTQNNGRVASDEFLPQGMRLLHFIPAESVVK